MRFAIGFVAGVVTASLLLTIALLVEWDRDDRTVEPDRPNG